MEGDVEKYEDDGAKYPNRVSVHLVGELSSHENS